MSFSGQMNQYAFNINECLLILWHGAFTLSLVRTQATWLEGKVAWYQMIPEIFCKLIQLWTSCYAEK